MRLPPTRIDPDGPHASAFAPVRPLFSPPQILLRAVLLHCHVSSTKSIQANCMHCLRSPPLSLPSRRDYPFPPRFRALDLRRQQMGDRLRLRHKVISALRKVLEDRHHFTEARSKNTNDTRSTGAFASALLLLLAITCATMPVIQAAL